MFVAVAEVVPVVLGVFPGALPLQRLVNQFAMELKPCGFPGHAFGQTFAAPPFANGATFALEQKQDWYVFASAVATAGGTQAPFASQRGPQALAQAGSLLISLKGTIV